MTIYNTDIVTRCQDAGLDVVLHSLSYEMIDDYPGFVTRLNGQIRPLYITQNALLQYLADRHHVGALLDVAFDGELPTPIERAAAPAGLGTDGNGVWFSTPSTGPATLRWYVNGAIRLRREQDLATNRSVTLAELDAQPGDVVQVCVEAGGVVGWWARIEIPQP